MGIGASASGGLADYSLKPEASIDRVIELAYIHKMFSWDTEKALRNYEKHGVTFEEAITVFGDPEALDLEDEKHPGPERRWFRLGFSIQGRLLLVIYTPRRLMDDVETIRIISVRQATRKERKIYARFPA